MKFNFPADDMREYCIFYLLIFLIAWTFNETDAIRRRNEKSQQTFVVRYRNGDQTIPVTVVLDDKKQTEYVINMSPRTPEKSVTLYDFKQRTIAYKDLTNQECFLGRLTDETLNHEINALSEVQSPIESNPKVLSLVPHKSALTPTEIRNIAGQKTAVFCRKMNTWLIMPQGTNHNISKREVQEVEERSYSRHGFHTVNYSHHGQETRRRYRKPSALSSRLTQKEERVSNQQSTNYGLQNSNSTSEDSSNNNIDFGKKFDSHEGDDNHYNSLFLPEATTYHPNTRDENLNVDYLDKNKHTLESDLNILAPKRLGELNIISHNDGNKELPTKYEEGLNNLNRNIAAGVGNNKNYIQSSEFGPLFHPSYLPNRNIDISNGNANAHNNRLSNIEIEADFPDESDIPEGKNFLSGSVPEAPTENPDVSINVLEIPRISKKFETLDHEHGSHENFVQPNEDVHSIFEGFHNLNGNSNTLHRNPSDLHDSFSSISIDGIHKTNSLSDEKLNKFDHEKSPVSDEVHFNNFYGEHTSHINIPAPIAENKNFPSANPLGYNNHNFTNIASSNYLNKNRNHHLRESQILTENNFPSDNLKSENSQSHMTLKNNINLSPSLRFNNNDFLSNFTIGPQNLPNDTRQKSPKFIINQPALPPNQVHLHDILRSFKPDEIVIDIGKIPTEEPPDSTSGFRGRDASFTRNFDRRLSLGNGHNRNFGNITNSGRTINSSYNLPSHRSHYPKIKNSQSQNRYAATFPPGNFLRTKPKDISPSFLSQLPSLGALPPGVSLHPRHPHAPYADMVRTNMLHTFPQRTNNRPVNKPHRQRHHRRKEHHDTSTCCKSNSRLSACCSWHLRRGKQLDSSCCASSKHLGILEQRRLIPTVHPRRVKYRPTLPSNIINPTLLSPQILPSRDYRPSVQRKIQDDKKDRCQKEKMCRTLYESTQQVMVCRNINVDGC